MSQHSDIYHDALISSLAGTADSRTPASELAAQAAKIALYCEYEHAQHNESKTHLGCWLARLLREVGIDYDAEEIAEDVVASAREKIRELNPSRTQLILNWAHKLGIETSSRMGDFHEIDKDIAARLDELLAVEAAAPDAEREPEVEVSDGAAPRLGYYFLSWGSLVHVKRSGVYWHYSQVATPASEIDDWGPRIPDYDHSKHAGMQLAWVEPELLTQFDLREKLKTCTGDELDALARKYDLQPRCHDSNPDVEYRGALLSELTKVKYELGLREALEGCTGNELDEFARAHGYRARYPSSKSLNSKPDAEYRRELVAELTTSEGSDREG